ncbi:MAG: hypothetical protein ACR2JB_26015 [Bryobacteraceae bacterium]
MSLQIRLAGGCSTSTALKPSWLGGTDLALIYDQQTSEFPLIGCASIHVDAIVRLALG